MCLTGWLVGLKTNAPVKAGAFNFSGKKQIRSANQLTRDSPVGLDDTASRAGLADARALAAVEGFDRRVVFFAGDEDGGEPLAG